MRLLTTLLLLLPLSAQAQTVRSVVTSDRPGSIKAPIELGDAKRVAEVCSEVSRRSPVDPDDDSAEADEASARWDAERKLVFAKVYRATVDPTSVRFKPYDVEDGALPIAVDKSLSALEGALLLSIMNRSGAELEVKKEEAKTLVERAENKELRLAVTFQIEGEQADELSPCWSYPKSESWSLRVIPLRYELTDESGKMLASVSTERMKEIEEWMAKKGPDVEITARAVSGVVDEAALAKSLDEKKSAIGACLAKAGDTASFGLSADVAGGKLGDLRVEMEASDDPAAAGCIVAALSGTPAPKASAGASVSVLVSVN